MSHFISRNGVRKALFSSLLLVLTGCSSLFSKPALYVPPANTADVAKVRLMGAPMSYALYQKDSAGKETGGWVQEHSPYFNILLGNTKDLGFPKLKNKDYSDTFFETTLVPEQLTTVHHSLHGGCSINIHFTPEKKGLYEVHYSYADKSGYCVIYIKQIKYDADLGLYYEANIK